MPFPLIPVALGGLSALFGALGNRKQTTTSQPTLDSAFAGRQGDLISQITKRMSDSGAGIEPLSLGMKSNVNSRFSALPDLVTTKLAQRGFAKSGQTGQALKGVEMARMQELGDVDTQMAKLQLDREDSGYDLAMRLLGFGTGQSTTTPGNVAAGAIGAGSETLTTLLLMQKLLGGGGGGTGNLAV